MYLQQQLGSDCGCGCKGKGMGGASALCSQGGLSGLAERGAPEVVAVLRAPWWVPFPPESNRAAAQIRRIRRPGGTAIWHEVGIARPGSLGHDGIGDVGLFGISTGTLLVMGALGVFAYFQLFKKGR